MNGYSSWVKMQRTILFVAVPIIALSMGSILFLPTAFDERMRLAMAVLVLGGAALGGLLLLSKAEGYFPVYALILLYVWIGYVAKLILTIADPGTSWLAQDLFTAEEVRDGIGKAFLGVVPGLLGLLVGMAAFGRARVFNDRTSQPEEMKTFVFVSAISALLALRLFNQLVLGIGLPGVKASYLGVPFINGILEFLSRPVVFALINFYFYSVLKLKSRRGLMNAVGLMLLNVGIGLSVGYKSELVLHGVFVLYCLFLLRSTISPGRRKVLLLTAALIVSATVILYPLINAYRFQRISGQTMSEAIASTTEQSASENSFLISIINRVNGIDAFYAATALGADRDFPWSAVFDDSVMDLIKERLYGMYKNDAVSSFGTTQLSVFFLAGGWFGVACGALAIGLTMGLTFLILRRWIFRYTVTYEAVLPSLCILWVKLIASGGLVFLFAKEWVLVVLCVYLTERYGFSAGRRRRARDPQRMPAVQWPNVMR